MSTAHQHLSVSDLSAMLRMAFIVLFTMLYSLSPWFSSIIRGTLLFQYYRFRLVFAQPLEERISDLVRKLSVERLYFRSARSHLAAEKKIVSALQEKVMTSQAWQVVRKR